MLGYRDEELLNEFSTWENLIHPEDMAGTRRTGRQSRRARLLRPPLVIRMPAMPCRPRNPCSRHHSLIRMRAIPCQPRKRRYLPMPMP